jgi:hypothetical protein
MGQEFALVNFTKREYAHPHDMGFGYKLGEFGSFRESDDFAGSLTHLARVMTADGGPWHGDRVAFVGDYGDAFGVDGSHLIVSEPFAETDEWERLPVDELCAWRHATSDLWARVGLRRGE